MMLGKIIERIYPIILGLMIMIISLFLDIEINKSGFNNILDNAITFSSIVIGFLAALLGILLTIRDSDIVVEIFNSKEKKSLRYFFNEVFALGFLIIIISSLMHLLPSDDNILFYISLKAWIFFVFWFLPSTYRIIKVLLNIFFRSNNSNINKRPKSNKLSKSESDKIKKGLSKDNN